jgi:ketosteroid isomerase-like protein
MAMSGRTEFLASTLIAANDAFYDAFDMGDYNAMMEVWAAEHPIACVHPGSDALFGRADVMRSWRDILAASSRPAIQSIRPRPMVFEEVGMVVCTEVLAGARLAASNLFVMENGAWRMVHHQAGPLNSPMPLHGPTSS